MAAKPTKIEDLLNVGHGYPPPVVTAPSSVSSTIKPQVKDVYTTIYGPSIDKFLETQWFTTRGTAHLANDPLLCEKYYNLLSRFNITANTDYHANLVTQSLEAHIIWETMLIARQVSTSITTTHTPDSVIEINEGVHDAAKRVEILETLITNQFFDPASLITDDAAETRSGTPKTVLETQLKTREKDFWRLISRFCSIKPQDGPAATTSTAPAPDATAASAAKNDDGDNTNNAENAAISTTAAEAPPASEIDTVLTDMRNLLDSRENRDVLYSFAIASHIGQQMAEKGAVEPPVSNDEKDHRTKFEVARQFISSEAAGKGTTQVVQRCCGMVVRSWGI